MLRWRDDEVERLNDAVEKYGDQWQKVAAYVKTRTPQQCSQRYQIVERPGNLRLSSMLR